MQVIAISGSPSRHSRSGALLQRAVEHLAAEGAGVLPTVEVRELPPAPLLAADLSSPSLRRAVDALAGADLVLVGTPIYKASYSGLLKLFLDVLPPDALRGRSVLPLATGGSLAHLLAVDYALRPVLAALGARHVLDTVYAVDAQFAPRPGGGHQPEAALDERIGRALAPLRCRLPAAA